MLVSVLISTYNSSRFIRQTIYSVLAQTFDDFEIVVVDDGSTDETCDIVSNIPDPRIRLIRKAHSGIPATYNRAVREAKGEFLARLGHDDLMASFRLELQIHALRHNPDVGVVHTNALTIDAYNRVIGRWDSADYGQKDLDRLFFRVCNNIIDPSTMVRRQVYDDVGLYDESLPMCNDFDFWIRAAKKWRFLHLPLQLIEYRRHGGNFSDERNKAIEHAEVGWILERMASKYRTLQELVPEVDWSRPGAEDSARRIAHGALVDRGYQELADRLFPLATFGSTRAAAPNHDGQRILIVMYGWADSGGGTILPRSIAKDLVRRGHDVTVFYAGGRPMPGRPPYFVYHHEEDGVRLRGVFNRPSVFMDLLNPEREILDPPILEAFRQTLDDFQPDVVHVHNFHNHGIALAQEIGERGIRGYFTPHNYWLVCPRLYLFEQDLSLCDGPGDGAKCASCVGRPEAPEQYASRRRLVRETFLASNLTVLALSKAVRDVLIANGFPPDRMPLLYQGHQQADRLWDEIGRDRLPAKPEGDIVFSFIGSALAHKGVHVLVQAAQQVQGRFQVRVYGDAAKAYVEALKALDKKGVVQWRGAYQYGDMARIFEETHVAVIPSIWYDNAPLAVSECLAARVPVLGANMGGIPEFIADGRTGRLFDGLRAEDLAARMQEIVDRPELVAEWQANIAPPLSFETYLAELEALYRGETPEPAPERTALPSGLDPAPEGPISVAWEGAQFIYHSLAHVNREVCLELLKAPGVELKLIPTEDPFFDPREIARYRPLIAAHRQPRSRPPQVHVRHQWPPNFNPPPSGNWVIIQPWEFGGIPAEWVVPLREVVDEVWVPSSWVRDCYIKSGVPDDKVVVVPNGVDTELFRPDGPEYPLETKKSFKFLFLGGTLGRKGIDLLIDAYRAAFTAKDDVCLVIKGSGKGHVYINFKIEDYLAEVRQNPDAPEIEYIDQELTDEDIAALYRAVDALAHPYRGEGFAMPIAEAMASGLPVIVPEYGACLDFCDRETAFMVPSTEVGIQFDWLPPASVGYWWGEPDKAMLAFTLRQIVADPAKAREIGQKARERIVSNFRWDQVAARYLERIRALAHKTPARFSPGFLDPMRFNPVIEPLEIEGLKAFNYLLRPILTEDRWIRALQAYLEAFRPEDDVAMVVRPEAGQPDVAGTVLDAIVRLGRDPEAIPDIVIVDQALSYDREGGLYTACQAFIALGSDSADSPEGRAREARACGLAIIDHPTPEALRALLAPGSPVLGTANA